MNIISNEELSKTVLQVVPKETLVKYGWVVLATPVIIFVVDKVHNLANAAMDKDKEFNVELMSFKLSIR